MLPPLPHIHPNHCTICSNLDYKYYLDYRYVKKSDKVNVRKPFPLSKVPNHLLDGILTKMYYGDFTRFRRTNKHYNKYVHSNRENLHIAMFHDKSIHLTTMSKNIPWLKFNSIYFWDTIRDSEGDPGELDIEVESCGRKRRTWLEYAMNRPFRRIIYTRCPIHVNLNEFYTYNGRRELIGCYKPVSVVVGQNFKVDRKTKWEPILLQFIHFLRWSRITESPGITLETRDINLSAIVQLFDTLQPRTATLYSREYLPRNFLGIDCFQNTKALVLYQIPDLEPEVLQNFEALQTYGMALTSEQFRTLLQDWINGKSKMKEMWIKVIDAFKCLQSIAAKKLSVIHAWKYYKMLGTNYMGNGVFVLEQLTTEKKTICALVPDDCKAKERRVYFKVIEK